MFSLKKIKFFFYKYNSILNTNSLYFILPLSFLNVVQFFYKTHLIAFYIASKNEIYIYLPKKIKIPTFKKYCDKHQKVYHAKNHIGHNNLYLTSFGLLYGKQAKKLNCGGRLLYSN